MSKRLIGELAATHAEALIDDWGLIALPIDPFGIAARHDITVVAKPSDAPGISGFLMRQRESFGIAYATHIKNDGFIRFTISHELGHYFLPGHPEKLFPNGSGVHASRSGFISNDECEVEADHFASGLLMPERLFVDALREAGAGFEAIKKLAATCRTSITATAIRYAKLSEDPVAVMISSGRNIDYCFMSAPLRRLRGITWIRKGELVPPKSETFEFNQDPANVKHGNESEGWTTLDHWLEGAPQVEMKEDVVGLGSYGKTLTVLFTEEPVDDEDVGDDEIDDDN
jgi:Zn-dependent peptidase ImmA (M78 family)